MILYVLVFLAGFVVGIAAAVGFLVWLFCETFPPVQKQDAGSPDRDKALAA